MKFFSNKDRIDKIRMTWMVTSVVILTSGVLLGQTTEELKEFKKRMAELEALQETISPVEPTEIETEIPARGEIVIEKTKVEKEALPYFGYDFFTKRERLDIYNNLPLPRDYQLGPGDEIIISIWGETQLRSSHVINRDGEIFIDKVGLVNLSGITMREAKDFLQNHFERVYATLKTNPKSTTFLDVSLGELKAINVSFVGEVTAPGMYSIHPFSTVTTGLIQSGGVALTGTLRNIQVIRNKRLIQQVDLYSFLLKGETESDIRLQNGDIIFVPVREFTVTITGEIRRSAIYETRTDESLLGLLNYAGGVEPTGSAQVHINRIIPLQERTSDDMAVKTVVIGMDKAAELVILDGDEVIVRKIHEVERVVSVEGQVKVEGTYSLSPDMRVLDLLTLAGGIFDDEYWTTVYPYRADLIRSYDKGTRSEIIPIKLDAFRSGDERHNLLLQHGDKLVVYPIDLNLYRKVVSIFGEVRKPGTYFLDSNMGISDLILRAGGFNYGAYPNEIEVLRVDPFNISSQYLSTVLNVKISEDIFESYPELDQFALQHHDQVIVRRYPRFQYQQNLVIIGQIKFPGVYALTNDEEKLKELIDRAGGFTEEAFEDGLTMYRAGNKVILRDFTIPVSAGDSIHVPMHPGVVQVGGEVYNPGLIHYRKGKSLKGYIESAGGFTPDADRGNVSVIYANGDVKKGRWFLDPTVREGATIIVYREEEKEPFDTTEFLKEVASIAASLATVIYIITR